MPGKNTPARRIDVLAQFSGGDAAEQETSDFAPPAVKSLLVPEHLVLSSQLERSAVTPSASVFAEWEAAGVTLVEQYAVQISEDPGFADDSTETYHTPRDQLSITIAHRKTGTLYYVRV